MMYKDIMNINNDAITRQIRKIEFSQKDVLFITGLGADKLSYWIRKGLIRPSVIRKGRGREHGFYKKAVYIIALARIFDEIGFDFAAIREIFKNNSADLMKYANLFSAVPKSEKTPAHLSITKTNQGPKIRWHEYEDNPLDEFRPSKIPGKKVYTYPYVTIIAMWNLENQLNIAIGNVVINKFKIFFRRSINKMDIINNKLPAKKIIKVYLDGLAIEGLYSGEISEELKNAERLVLEKKEGLLFAYAMKWLLS